jgi:hypothetical protein
MPADRMHTTYEIPVEEARRARRLAKYLSSNVRHRVEGE